MPRPTVRRLSLRIARRIDAPASRIWKAWTTRSEMAKWFGEGPDARVHELDARPGGRLRVTFPPAAREDRAGNYFGVYLSVRPTRELVLVVIDKPSRWSETVRMRLTPGQRATKMVFETSIADESAREATRKGWSTAFDRLASLVERA